MSSEYEITLPSSNGSERVVLRVFDGGYVDLVFERDISSFSKGFESKVAGLDLGFVPDFVSAVRAIGPSQGEIRSVLLNDEGISISIVKTEFDDDFVLSVGKFIIILSVEFGSKIGLYHKFICDISCIDSFLERYEYTTAN